MIGQRIAECRREMGLSQSRLAEMLGWPRQRIHVIERAESLNTRTVQVLASALGVSISELFPPPQNVESVSVGRRFNRGEGEDG